MVVREHGGKRKIRGFSALNPATEHCANKRNGRTRSAKVATGEYGTESEVIPDGLRTLLARDRAVEAWLREQGSSGL